MTSIHSYLWACRRIGITPERVEKDGTLREPQSFDEPQVVLIKKAAAGPASVKKPLAKTGGGPSVRAIQMTRNGVGC